MIIRRPLDVQARVALASSDKLLIKLLSALAADTTDQEPDLRQAAFQTLLAEDPMRLRHGDINRALDEVWPKGCDKHVYSLDYLHALAEAHMFFDGDRFSARPNRTLDYSKLIVDVEPAFLIGALIAERLADREISVASIDRLLTTQCAIGLPRPESGWDYADNHVHFGGVSSMAHVLGLLATARRPLKDVGEWKTPARFQGIFEDHFKKKPMEIAACAYMMTFSYLLKCAYRNVNRDKDQNLSPDEDQEFSEYAAGLRVLLQTGVYDTSIGPLFMTGLAEMPGGDNDLSRLAVTAAKQAKDKHWDRAFLVIGILVSRIDRLADHKPPRLRWALAAFVHLTHALRTAVIMRGAGLESFIEYFNSKMRKHGEDHFDRMAWLIGRSEQNAEFKTAWVDHKSLSFYADARRKLFEASETQEFGDFHLSYHFIRQGNKPEKRLTEEALRDAARREELRTGARKLCNQMKFPKYGNIGDDAEGHADLNSLIRSFDVAGDENGERIELFAPALRFLRERALTAHDRDDALAPRRNLSIHAGEDFDFLVSGLRHIDETVEFCNMGLNDRIGHGLALGLSPHAWAERQQQCFVPIRRHLDNLVWLWGQAARLAGRLPSAGAAVPGLERRIQKYAAELNLASPQPQHLFDAWRLRRNCPMMHRKGWNNASMPGVRYWVPDYEILEKDDDVVVKIFNQYLRNYNERKEKNIIVEFKNNGEFCSDRDHWGKVELDLIEAVQDHLMTRYDSRGVIIEACPSSNLYISRIDNLEDHPVMRWRPPQDELLEDGAAFNRYGLRNGPVKVCVNTDDPGVFPTDIANEHRLLADAARTRFKLSRRDAERWIEEIRRIGVDVFRQAHSRIRRRTAQ